MNEVQRLIQNEIEIDRQINTLRFREDRFQCGHPKYTPDWYDALTLAREAHVAVIKPQVDALNAQRMNVLDQLRSLPRDQAEFLLRAYTWMVDGDSGYGSWPDPTHPFHTD